MKVRNRLLAAAALVFVPVLATATPITGEFGMGGSATVTAISLDFFCALGGCPGTSGDFTVSAITTTGDFVPVGGTRGFIKDISQGGGQPLNTLFSLAQWISFVASPTMFLDLQFIPLGQGTPSADCVGVTFCTPIIGPLVGSPNNPAGLSAFNLSPGSASFEVRGIGYKDSAGTGATPFVGRFSADFAGLTAADIVALFNDPGITNKAYSANFVVTFVPEPSTATMMIVGGLLASIGVLGRRFRRKDTV
jgi:hypothetical protein